MLEAVRVQEKPLPCRNLPTSTAVALSYLYYELTVCSFTGSTLHKAYSIGLT